MPEKADDKYKDPVKAMLEERQNSSPKAANAAGFHAAASPESEEKSDISLADLSRRISGDDPGTPATPFIPLNPEQSAANDPQNAGQPPIVGTGSELVPVTPEKSELLAKGGADSVQKGSESGVAKGAQQTGEVRVPIGEKLVARGLISRDQLEISLKVQRDSSKAMMIGAILVEMGFITESALGEVLTESSGVQQFDPKNTIIDPNLVKQVPKEVANRFKAVPILLEGDSVYVAMTDIYNVLAIDRVQRYFPKRFKMVPVHCSATELSELIDNYYDYELSIDGILREMEAIQAEELNKPQSTEDGYTNPTVRLIDALLVDGIKQGASDLHFEPEGAFVRLRYRVDGELRLIRSFHRDYWMAIVVRVKIIAGMNITETRIPQDGRITLTVMGRKVDFRVATHPTIYGENIVLRILDKEKALVPLEALGFSPPNVDALMKGLKRPEGIIVVTGPTGSGKTTTLYSILSFINTPNLNIMTLEDPVEYQLPMIRQSNIREGVGLDFASGIKSLMRQDPDVIFVGEVRDMETATMAMRASMTGHQVYTSLHTNDAIGAIPRLIDIGVQPSILAGNINMCIAQRLARKLCKCKAKRAPTPQEVKVLGLTPEDEVWGRVGCDTCYHTGYKGRIAISELILVDEGLDELIAQGASKAEMMRHMKKKGFIPMADDGIAKAKKGITDLEELITTINLTDRL